MAFSPWEMIDNGSFNGVVRYIRSSDDDEGTVQVKSVGYDAPIIVEANKKAQNEWGGRFGKADLIHAATVPASVMLQWFMTDGVWALDDMDYMVKKLNDPEWAYLKRLPIQL